MEDTLEESLTKDGVYNLDQLGNMGFANDRDELVLGKMLAK